MKFAEHIHANVLEDVPQRHIVFTIPKRLRVFFKYDRSLLSILFNAAWGALSEVLGADQRELSAIPTVQTAGEALNYPVVSLSNHTLTFTVSSPTATGTTVSSPHSLMST